MVDKLLCFVRPTTYITLIHLNTLQNCFANSTKDNNDQKDYCDITPGSENSYNYSNEKTGENETSMKCTNIYNYPSFLNIVQYSL